MRKMVAIILVALGMVGMYMSGLFTELSFFLIAGKIPFTSVFIPATIMLLFWVFILPVSLAFRASVVGIFWFTIEKIGHIHQRQLNRRFRETLPIKRRSPLTHLFVITLLHTPHPAATSAPETVTLRRRFAALQM